MWHVIDFKALAASNNYMRELSEIDYVISTGVGSKISTDWDGNQVFFVDKNGVPIGKSDWPVLVQEDNIGDTIRTGLNQLGFENLADNIIHFYAQKLFHLPYEFIMQHFTNEQVNFRKVAGRQSLTFRRENGSVAAVFEGAVQYEVLAEEIQRKDGSFDLPKHDIPGTIRAKYLLTNAGYQLVELAASNKLLQDLCAGNLDVAPTPERIAAAEAEERKEEFERFQKQVRQLNQAIKPYPILQRKWVFTERLNGYVSRLNAAEISLFTTAVRNTRLYLENSTEANRDNAVDNVSAKHLKNLRYLAEEEICKKYYLISQDKFKRQDGEITAQHWQDFLDDLWHGKIV